MAIIRRSMPRELNIRWASGDIVCYTAVFSVVTQRSSPLSGEERCVTGDTVPLTFPIGFLHFVLHFFCCANELSRLTTEGLFELLFFQMSSPLFQLAQKVKC